jgi:hypothetical protein
LLAPAFAVRMPALTLFVSLIDPILSPLNCISAPSWVFRTPSERS